MRWPWVSRSSHEAAVALRDGMVQVLRAQLERAESERREAHIQILRMSQGLPIFPEQQIASLAQPQPAAEALPQLSFAHMAEDELNAHLVREAKQAGCITMGQIVHHVNRRKRELWQEEHPEAKPPLSPAEADLRAQAVREVLSAVDEGKAAAVPSIDGEAA